MEKLKFKDKKMILRSFVGQWNILKLVNNYGTVNSLWGVGFLSSAVRACSWQDCDVHCLLCSLTSFSWPPKPLSSASSSHPYLPGSSSYSQLASSDSCSRIRSLRFDHLQWYESLKMQLSFKDFLTHRRLRLPKCAFVDEFKKNILDYNKDYH